MAHEQHLSLNDTYLDQDNINELYQKLVGPDSILVEMLAKAALSSHLETMTEMFSDAEEDRPLFDSNDVRQATSSFIGDVFEELGRAIQTKISEIQFKADIKLVRSVETKIVFE